MNISEITVQEISILLKSNKTFLYFFQDDHRNQLEEAKKKEISVKGLDSALKKTTAFMKKLKTLSSKFLKKNLFEKRNSSPSRPKSNRRSLQGQSVQVHRGNVAGGFLNA